MDLHPNASTASGLRITGVARVGERKPILMDASTQPLQ